MDMESLMAQAAELQNKVSEAQELLAKSTVRGISAGGACVVTLTGKYDLIDLVLRDDALSGGAATASEIVASAFRDAKSKADMLIDRVMGDATAGMPMPE